MADENLYRLLVKCDLLAYPKSFTFGGRPHGGRTIDTTGLNSSDISTGTEGDSTLAAQRSVTNESGSKEGNNSRLHDEIAVAMQFAKEFNPVSGVNYDWLLEQTKNYYWTIDKDSENIDAKANSLISYYGAGTGLLVVASTIAVCEGKIPASVGWWFAPAVVCGLAAIVLALISRWPCRWIAGPGTPACNRYINHYLEIKRADGTLYNDSASATKRAEYYTIGTWYHSAVENSIAVGKKAWWLNLAYIASAASVVLLLIPFLLAMIKKC